MWIWTKGKMSETEMKIGKRLLFVLPQHFIIIIDTNIILQTTGTRSIAVEVKIKSEKNCFAISSGNKKFCSQSSSLPFDSWAGNQFFCHFMSKSMNIRFVFIVYRLVGSIARVTKNRTLPVLLIAFTLPDHHLLLSISLQSLFARLSFHGFNNSSTF